MSSRAQDLVSLTFAEYVAGEDAKDTKDELIGGFVRAMAGGTPRHNLVASAAVAMLWRDAQRHGCRVYAGDTLLRIGDDGFYPDVMVVCEGEIGVRYETSPCLIIEVLSPSTQDFDRNAKRASYTQIPGLQQYLIISPDTFITELYSRVADRWVRSTAEMSERIRLACPPIELELTSLFEAIIGMS